MTVRLTSAMLVAAMVRRVQQAGGSAAVLARGDDTAGEILIVCRDRGVFASLLQRLLGADGAYRWAAVAATESTLEEVLVRRQSYDPDLWLIELDVPDAERFAAETSGEG